MHLIRQTEGRHEIGQRFPEAETFVLVAIHPLISTAGPDWAPDKLSSFGPNPAAVIALAPPPVVLRLLLPFEPVGSVNVYLASPVCGVEGYKLEATPLMIQKGPRHVRLSPSRRASFAIYRLSLFTFFRLPLSLSFSLASLFPFISYAGILPFRVIPIASLSC